MSLLKNPDDEAVVETMCNQLVDQLRSIREKKGITAYVLQGITGIRQPNIVRMEKFEAIPNLKTIITVCEALEVELVIRKKKKPAEDQQEDNKGSE